MKVLAKTLGSKWFMIPLLASVGLYFLVLTPFSGQVADPAEKILHNSGEVAIWMLGAVLALTPLRVLFPRSAIIGALNRHRRAIGVSSGLYGLIHFSFHLLTQGLLQGDWESVRHSFGNLFVWYGLGGLTILLVLTLTSNGLAMRLLGGRKWKQLHRLVYLAAALLIYHQAIAGKGHWYIAKYLFFPLAALELARLAKTYLFAGSIRQPPVL